MKESTQSNLPPFYVGQKVVAVTDSARWSKGDMFVIISIKKGCCGYWQIDIGISVDTCCHICDKDCGGSYFDVFCFAPIHEDFQQITLSKVIEIESSLISVN